MKAKQEDVIKKRQLQLAKKDAQARLIEKEKERKKKKEQQKVNYICVKQQYEIHCSVNMCIYTNYTCIQKITSSIYYTFDFCCLSDNQIICKNVLDAIFK